MNTSNKYAKYVSTIGFYEGELSRQDYVTPPDLKWPAVCIPKCLIIIIIMKIFCRYLGAFRNTNMNVTDLVFKHILEVKFILI